MYKRVFDDYKTPIVNLINERKIMTYILEISDRIKTEFIVKTWSILDRY